MMRANAFKKFVGAAAVAVVLSMVLGCAGGNQLTPQDLSFTQTVRVPGMDKDELFSRIHLWSTSAFTGPETPFPLPDKSMVLSNNQAAGSIRAQHTNVVMSDEFALTVFMLTYSNVNIAVSDEQYQITFEISNVSHNVYSKSNSQWAYSKKFPPNAIGKGFHKKHNSLALTKTTWQQLSDALRTTVSGQVID